MAAEKSDASMQEIESILHKEGFIHTERVTDSLQGLSRVHDNLRVLLDGTPTPIVSLMCNTGSVWKAEQWSTKRNVVIKVTNRQLYSKRVVILSNGKTIPVYEDCVKEKYLLRYLTKTHEKEAPPSIVKYVDFFKSENWFFLVMQNGGKSLFDFVSKAHEYIMAGKIDVVEWRKMVRLMFGQMVQAVEYIHGQNISHFDISLENFVVNDITVSLDDDDMIQFDESEVQVKLCDFGLAEAFDTGSSFESDKFCGKPCYKSPEIMDGKRFNAKCSDIWALGVCLFTMLIGGMPFLSAKASDHRYSQLMKPKGMHKVLKHWHKLNYVDDNLIRLLESIMQPERERANLAQIKRNAFLR